MVRAKELFSASVLADPRSSQALAALRQLAAEDRIIQLCNVEAMEQVQKMERLLPVGFRGRLRQDRRESLRAHAAGGRWALRSEQRWYNLLTVWNYSLKEKIHFGSQARPGEPVSKEPFAPSARVALFILLPSTDLHLGASFALHGFSWCSRLRPRWSV
ncbi:DUF930 domain-containing protein [Sinorhizobium fredii]|uniref:DUF930 domain-containing protein n=1 Tax=Rhizobium fredii TaxID=380 RepID=UPI0011818BB5